MILRDFLQVLQVIFQESSRFCQISEDFTTSQHSLNYLASHLLSHPLTPSPPQTLSHFTFNLKVSSI